MTTSFWSSLSTLGTNFTQIFCIFSSLRIIVCTVATLTSNCALIVSIDTQRSLSMKYFIWPIKFGILTSLLLPHLSSSLTDSLPSSQCILTPTDKVRVSTEHNIVLDLKKILKKLHAMLHYIRYPSLCSFVEIYNVTLYTISLSLLFCRNIQCYTLYYIPLFALL